MANTSTTSLPLPFPNPMSCCDLCFKSHVSIHTPKILVLCSQCLQSIQFTKESDDPNNNPFTLRCLNCESDNASSTTTSLESIGGGGDMKKRSLDDDPTDSKFIEGATLSKKYKEEERERGHNRKGIFFFFLIP
eukprot:TRINITY_DN2374_c0_g1_i3.p1 TRINITY_DN2374_c0_g1~~TRINITY_DN2374_c0_g1_i3.p1  ORF type:complete len:134 (-),score=32.55 TRINITY_DN2374_c0_g1_i3:381-782(-)